MSKQSSKQVHDQTGKQLGKPACYVASPLGFAESTRPFYYDVLLPLVGKYTNVHDPWDVDDAIIQRIMDAPLDEKPALWHELGIWHYDVIAKQMQLMVACLDQEPPDNGTVAEIAYAAAHNVPIIGYRGDFRSTGEAGMQYNLMIGAAIKMSHDVEVNDLKSLEKALVDYTDFSTGSKSEWIRQLPGSSKPA